MRARILMLIGAALIFGVVNWQVAGKERLRANGQPVYLDLAPKDPRSLMQGDYMALNFDLARQISLHIDTTQDGRRVAIVKLNDRRIANFVRLDTGGAPGPGEMRFRFRIRRGDVWLGTNAFFFHEGDGERFQPARFGEFRVNEDGDAMLVDLRDKDLQKF